MNFLVIIILEFFLIAASHAADFTLKSPNFQSKAQIPVLFTCDGENISPALVWSKGPANTKSYALILYSPYAPGGFFYNWVVFNIPPNVTSFPVGHNNNLPESVLVGNNSMGDAIYRGPCPPDSLLHYYVFSLFALNIMLDLPAGVEAEEVFTKMKHHILKKTDLQGTYRH